ncbi:MAG: nuclear transport factor 2 family protein [Planctomycetota bacterium]|nr:nuclear transport factor 2 family protein [Planctomycetota bacterium]
MKRLFLCTTFVALTALVSTLLTGLWPDTAHSAAPDYDAEEIAKELTQLSVAWGKAPLTKNTGHLKQICADDFSYIMPDGTVHAKTAFIALYEDDTNTYTKAANIAFKVRVYGQNFALTVGDDHYAGEDKDGQPFSNKGRFTNVWVRRNGRWQVVAGHASKLE